jgi:hypothetical protein
MVAAAHTRPGRDSGRFIKPQMSPVSEGASDTEVLEKEPPIRSPTGTEEQENRTARVAKEHAMTDGRHAIVLKYALNLFVALASVVLVVALVAIPPPLSLLDHVPKASQGLVVGVLIAFALLDIFYGFVQFMHFSRER